ncbi:hypothetical protein ASH00_14645 [Arthrobacter sp. Soil782]|nr:hypothetical protein ASH00_14645 [Arthrobacter sp. Soil782]
MDKNMNYEMAFSAVRRLVTYMAPTATGPTVSRIAKGAFGMSMVVATAAVTVVYCTESPTRRTTE